jgi:hypothetical protein
VAIQTSEAIFPVFVSAYFPDAHTKTTNYYILVLGAPPVLLQAHLEQQFPPPMKQFGANCGNKESTPLDSPAVGCGARRKRPESRREVPGKRRPATPALCIVRFPFCRFRLPLLHTCVHARRAVLNINNIHREKVYRTEISRNKMPLHLTRKHS